MQQIIKALLLAMCLTQTSTAGIEQFVALITLDGAVKKIIQQGNNKVLATKTESENGRKVHIIKVLTPNGRIQHIKIDVDSGKIVK